ncbi:MAG: putative Ig domain-containing protein [Planctomycetota bacterium]
MNRAALSLVALSWCVFAFGCNGSPNGPIGPREERAATPPAPSGLTLSPQTLPDAVAGQIFGVTLTVDGEHPLSWELLGSLPPGLSIALGPGPAANAIKGVSFVPGFYSFTVVVTDARGHTGRQGYVLEVGSAGALPAPGVFELSPPHGSPLFDATVGDDYLEVIGVTDGGTGPYTIAGAGFAPPGLTTQKISGTTVAIHGTPLQEGTYVVSLHVRDAAGVLEVEDYFLNVLAPRFRGP